MILVVACGSSLPARPDGVAAALQPAVDVVSPGSEFQVELDVTVAGALFDGYDTVISYDPAVLTFLPASPPSGQEGAYMTGACGTTFHYFAAAGDSFLISHVILCGGQTLPGPGELYRLRFRAPLTQQVTWIRIRHIQFYDGGFFVPAGTTADAEIDVVPEAGVPGGGPASGPALVRVAPNPARGPMTVLVRAPRDGEQDLRVLDIAGRTVCRVQNGWFAAGERALSWTARDDAGLQLAPGLYRMLLRSGTSVTGTRFTVLR